MKKLALIVLFALAGCQSVTPPQAYLHADRMTKQAVEPMLRLTAQDHPDLQPSIDDLLQSWELRLQNAEQSAQ